MWVFQALWLAALSSSSASCAGVHVAGAAATVDVRAANEAGVLVDAGTLDRFRGQVVVVDLCASWATACNLNAKVLDEVGAALTARGARAQVALLTVLVDDDLQGKQALSSYRSLLGVEHAVLLAGPRTREGGSALQGTGYVPRLLIFDKQGALVVDESGGVLNVQGVLDRIDPLL